MKFDNAIRRQVMSLPELIRTQYKDLEPKTRCVLTTPEIFSIQKILLTGCGDSYAAALASKYAFESLTGVPTDVVTAIELSRYYPEKQLGFAPHNPLVIAVSNSGKVARVGEAIQRAAAHDAFSLGITGSRDSLLGKSSGRVLDLDVPPFESAPGTRSYMVALMSLFLIAIRIGEVRGNYTMDYAMDIRHEMAAMADKMEDALCKMDQQVINLAESWKDMEAYDFIGSGADYAAAWFGHTKIFEALGRYSMHINTEDWLHLNCFMRRVEKIGTVLVCGGDSPAKSRAGELLGYAEKMGRSMVVITDDPKAFPIESACCIQVPALKFALLNPMMQFVPICLLAGYMMEMTGEENGRGCKGPWSFCKGGAAIHNSEIEII